MTGLILEALLALAILLIIVWWTMFSGRPRGELSQTQRPAQEESPKASSAPTRQD